MDNVNQTSEKQAVPDNFKAHIFTSENQPKNRGRKKGSSPTDWLRKLARTKIDFKNPLTGKPDRATVSMVVAIQLILKATQDSDLPSIKEYFDRLDGKAIQTLIGEGFDTDTKIILINPKEKQDADRPNAVSI